jgi:2-methylcitrate dehydratase
MKKKNHGSRIPQTYQIAAFALRKKFSNLKPPVVDQLKRHLLDSVGSMIHCLHRPTINKLTAQIDSLSGEGICIAPVVGKTTFDRATQLLTALIRYPDFMDNFLGKESTCHPSDNIGGLLAASQLVDATGEDFLIAMAVAYEIECRLIEEVPVMVKGFDHTLLLSYSLTAAMCKLLQLSEEQTAHAISIAGNSFNPLVTCRASYTYEWKGLMSSFVAMGCANIVQLARQDLTGPIELFNGNKGFSEVFGMELDYNWKDDRFELIARCILKSYNAEVHTQSLIEAALELKKLHHLDAAKIRKITAETFLTVYHIVGGGAYGDRMNVHSKEQADHSLPYVLSAALLDGELSPAQLLPSRINKPDIQKLIKKVEVKTKFPIHKPVEAAGLLDPYTKAYPDKIMGTLTIEMNNGKTFSIEKEDYKGFHTRPLSWEDVIEKFKRLTYKEIDELTGKKIISVINNLENHSVNELVRLLAGSTSSERKTIRRSKVQR